MAVKNLVNPTIGILADKKFGDILACCRNVDVITLKVGEKNIGKVLPIRQIRQSFYLQVFLPYGINLLSFEHIATLLIHTYIGSKCFGVFLHLFLKILLATV